MIILSSHVDSFTEQALPAKFVVLLFKYQRHFYFIAHVHENESISKSSYFPYEMFNTDLLNGGPAKVAHD